MKKKQTFFPTDPLALKERALNDTLITKPKNVEPLKAQTPTQKVLLKKLKHKHHDILIVTGPAGSGKTYMTVREAVAQFLAGDFEKLVITRPNVESGDRLGFLPGDLKQKMDPYLLPIYDVLHEVWTPIYVERMIQEGTIEIAPLAFMRGRTFKNAFVILDEAQNTTPEQMQMFLTRIGSGSRMVITGDVEQFDRKQIGEVSGLRDVVKRLEARDAERAAELPAFLTEGVTYLPAAPRRWDRIGIVRMSKADVVRHEVIEDVLDMYAQAA